MTARLGFEHQLKSLNENLAQMGRYVEDSIDRIFVALKEQDSEAAKEIVEGDRMINDMEKTIEAQCLSMITRQQPVARDLRLISAALKVVTDVERIGDHAADIAEILVQFENTDFYHASHSIPAMLEAAKKMVHDSVDSFIARDVKAAEEVIKADDIVDGCFDKVKQEVIVSLKEGQEDIDCFVDILMIAKYLERIGDHAVNIGEWTIFQQSGAVDNIRIL